METLGLTRPVNDSIPLTLALEALDQAEQLGDEVQRLKRRLANDGVEMIIEKQDGTILTLAATGLTLEIINGQAVLTGRVALS